MSRDAVIDYAIRDYESAYEAAWQKKPGFEIGYTNGWICFHLDKDRHPERYRLAQFIEMAERLRDHALAAVKEGKRG